MLKKNKNKFFLGLALSVVLCTGIFLAVGPYWSQGAKAITIDEVGATIGLGTADLKQTIINIIKWALGLLGLVAVIYIMYGGFIWMTAAGNVDKVKKAKRIIIQGVIGLIIILLAWAIVSFVIQAITNATNPVGPGGPGGPPGTFDPHFVWNEAETAAGSPPNDDVYLCSRIKSTFNNRIAEASVTGNNQGTCVASPSTPCTSDINCAVGDTCDLSGVSTRLKIVDMTDPANPAVGGVWTVRTDTLTFRLPPGDPANLWTANNDYQLRIPNYNAGIYSLYDSSPDQTRLDTIASSFLGTGSDYFYFDFHTGWTVDNTNPTLDGANTYPRYYTPPASPITSSDRNVSMVPIFRFPFSEDIDIDSITDVAGHPSVASDGIIGDFILERLDGPRGNVVNPDGTPGNTPYDNTKLEVLSDAVTHGFAVNILNQGVDKLASFTWYRITLSGVEDLCGNQMTPITSWEFETNDTQPRIDYLDPPDGASNVCPSATISAAFNTSMYNETVTMHVTGGGLDFTLAVNPSNDGPIRSVMVGGQRVDIEVMDFDNGPTQNDYNKWFSIHPGPASTFQLPIDSDIDVDITTTLVMDINGNTLGKNDWNFSVSDLNTCACSPFIGQIQPASGQRGQCVSIFGSCFNGTTNHRADDVPLLLQFDEDYPNNPVPFDVDTADRYVDPSGGYMTTTIPAPAGRFTACGPSDPPEQCRPEARATIDFDEDSYGTAQSNSREFYISDTGEANGPCLLSLSPNRGRPGIDTVTLNGTRFLNPDPDPEPDSQWVSFRDGAFTATTGTVSSWSDTQALAVIDSGAHSSPDPGLENMVYLHNANGDSNMLPMNIYTPLPGQPYVISHGPVCTNACVNTMIWAEFNTDMNQASVEGATSLNVCNDLVGDPNCLTAYAPIAGGIDFNWPSASRAEISAVSGNLSPDQKYRVIVGNAAQNTEGGSLTQLNFNGNSYSWVFTTRDNADPCAVQSVVVAPADRTEMINRTIGYSAQAFGPPDTCNSPINPGAWGNWFSAADPTTTYFDFNNQNNNQVDVLTVGATGGAIDISAQADSVTGSGSLTIVDCNANIDCQVSCLAQTGFANNSRCVSGQCTPVVGYLSPHPTPNTNPVSGAGPKDAMVTIQGCFFGDNPGNVDFAGTPAEVACGISGWSDNEIIVKNPIDVPVSGPVSVTTNGGLTPRAGDTKIFTATTNCTTSGAPVPTAGMPGICPPFFPVPGTPGDTILFSSNNNGYNLFGTYTFNTAQGEFTDILGNFVNGVNGQGGGTRFFDRIPDSLNITSGNARVAVRDNPSQAFCYSNELYLPISCSNAGDCASGCCKDTSPYGRICRPFAECSTGGEGEPCQMSDNPNCQDGPVVSPGNFQCISNTGDTSSKPPSPSVGSDCRVCCSLDSNNDNVYNDPQVSSSGLVCTADQGACTDEANPGRRGLYCGCTTDSQCLVGQGCSDLGARCCYDKPQITSVGNNVCRNGIITINFNTLMDTSTLNKENIKVFYDNGSSTTCLSGTPFFSMNQSETNQASSGKLSVIFDWIKDLVSPTVQAAAQNPLPPGNWCSVDIWLANRTENGHTLTIIGPNGLMPGGTTIGIIVKGGPSAGGGVYSNQRLTMTDYAGNSNVLNYDFDDDGAEDSYSSIYVTGPDVCQLDHVDIEGQPSFSWPLYDLFTCAGLDNCAGDSSVLAGNQHTYIAHAYDQGNHEISADANSWSVEDPQDVIDTPLPNNVSVADITSLVKNGLAYVKAEATAYGVTKSATTQVRVNLCEHPWPNPFVGEHFPFEDSFNFRQPDSSTGNNDIYTNFAISYCKDPGDLPTISSTLVKNGNANIYNDKYQELVKEYFFLFDDTQPNKDDVIGIRVMENVQGLSPTEWYRKQFGPAAPEPQALTVDGYPAVRAGRTVYVAATNLICHNDALVEVDCLDGTAINGRLYNNIYLISYNEGASDKTVDIYNRLLQNWEFNVNISRTDREKMWRDMKRLNDLNDIYAKMLDYKTANGHFPLLEGGTFIQGMSNSKWPSWQDTLGAALGGNLPVDPVNDFVNAPEPAPQLCLEANGFSDPNTCWDEGDKDFEAPQNSHLYMYVVGPSGDFANLYTKMEYLGVGSWMNYSPTPPEPCDGSSSFCDNVFNFEFLLSGNLQDHDGPNISGVTYQTNNLDGLTIGDSGLIEVTADDVSGVNRVEFYIDGVRKYTDTEMSDSWTWNFDSRQYADGDYEFIARAYDNMGNRRDRRANFTINNGVGPDTTPPFVQIISHSNGDRISGTVNFIAVASDNVSVFDTWIRVYRSDAAFPLNPADAVIAVMCSSPNADYCTLAWDSIGTPNGNYIVQAEAMDLSFPANDHAFDEITVVLDNTDTDPPNVVITSSDSEGICALGTCQGNGAICSVLQTDLCADGSACIRETCNAGNGYACTAPAAGNFCQRSGLVHVSVTADDAQSNITRVVYSVDGTSRYTDDVADSLGITSSWDWNTEQDDNTNPRVAPPPHTLTVTAYDQYGHPGSASLNFGTFNESTDTIAPVVSFNTPPTPTDYSTVSGPFTINVSAIDNLNAVAYVDFYFDYVYRRTVQGPLAQYTYDITQQFLDQLSNGCHTFSARAVDTAGNERNSEVRHIGVRQNCYGEAGQGPRIVGDGVNSIVSPHSVQVGDTVTIRARVSDPDGVTSVIAYIQNPDEDPPIATITMTCVDGPCTTGDTRLGIYQGTWVATGSLDPYYVDIVAIDNIGQRSEAENVF